MSLKNKEISRKFKIVAGGDVCFGRWKKGIFIQHGGIDPFRNIRNAFEKADLSFVNLEAALCHSPEYYAALHGNSNCCLFATPISYISLLKELGIKLVSVANNHALDAGIKGFREMCEALRKNSIYIAGERKFTPPLFFKTDYGQEKVFALAKTDQDKKWWPGKEVLPLCWLHEQDMRSELLKEIRAIREKYPYRFLMVSLHWGKEREPMPSPSQISLAHDLIDAGVNLLLGHHSHVFQPVELYKGGVIAYSLGNLLFDMKDKRVHPTALLKMVWDQTSEQVPWRVHKLILHLLQWNGTSSGPIPVDRFHRPSHFDLLLKRSSQEFGMDWIDKDTHLLWQCDF